MIDDIKGSEQRKKHSNINLIVSIIFRIYTKTNTDILKKNTSMVTIYP